jgi:hypothetical protein
METEYLQEIDSLSVDQIIKDNAKRFINNLPDVFHQFIEAVCGDLDKIVFEFRNKQKFITITIDENSIGYEYGISPVYSLSDLDRQQHDAYSTSLPIGRLNWLKNDND